MNFSDILTATRKAKNLSQEQLAEQVGVSRQAISKWELGDTTPDLPKLLALSEALGISLDVLCGRIPAEETAAESVSASPAPASPKNRRGWYLLLGALAGIVLVVAGIFLLNIPRGDHQTDVPVPAIPADFTVAGVNFECDSASGVLSFRFTPSLHYPEDFTYTVVFASTGKKGAHRYEAVYEGGVCLGTGEGLPRGYAYDVSVTVSNGREALSIPVAENLGFAPGQASWTPLV